MNAMIFAAMLAATCLAEDAAPVPATSAWTEMKKWLRDLRTAISESAVRRHQRQMRGALAVAAVRGSRQTLDDPSKPYWKGTAASKQEREERRERAELSLALNLALEGKNEEAAAALDEFESAHPKSALLEDCRQARERLKAAADAATPGMPGSAAAKAETKTPEAARPEADRPAPVEADGEKK